ncbi:sn-glycerol-3-phosphate ABC transporter ATP-binding protein UgpC [Paenibacillus sp. J5C_2022]|uniref:ABC transporter ATP-binding protein n=1 Tax=Paenibacillus sp. J5C2022 TaxID=2977129 RepID=UPI0021D11DE1|nr:sn-glycerol-3-phosphate ABC transporter ATP-binding protein UgpC [Paenibacillus sp. J5C2022]MCU6710930.1 sn-glycerol-3-phosphate ABC transporter ATP-binding protein UgpC [Paenibacillus sp. J5C2022]
MARVTFSNVKKRYAGERQDTIENFNLEAESGQFLVLVGPSGCGKSTLLRMLAGLEDATEGDILIDGKRVNDVSSKDRNIAMVFQNYALYPHMSVFENIAFGLRLRKLPKAEIQERVVRAARILDIEPFLSKQPRQLSGGQRQRVALGRAIVREPEVFLMDEPLSNLDAKLRVQMREEIGKLYRKLGRTFIYVTHDQIEAMTMGTKIVVMRSGKILQADTPENIYNRPANMFVASFIGSPPINFVHGRIKGDEAKVIFDTRRYGLHIPAEKAGILLDKGYMNKQVVLGVRAEDIVCKASAFAEDEFIGMQYKSTVEMKELLGSDTYLYLHNKEHRLVARVSPRIRFEEGQEVHVGLEGESLLFFDSGTEELLC